MTKRLLFVIAALSSSLLAYVAAPATEPIEQDRASLKITIYEEADDQRTVLFRPMIMSEFDQPFMMVVGRQTPRAGVTDVEDLPLEGQRVSGMFQRAADGNVWITLNVYLGTRIEQNDDRATHLVRAESFDIHTKAAFGETLLFDCGNQQWCELKLEAVSSEPVAEAQEASLFPCEAILGLAPVQLEPAEGWCFGGLYFAR